MPHSAVNSLLIVLAVATAAQWVAWFLRLPAILLLLLAGFLAGPIAGLIHPDALFKDLLLPLVSLSVALILFEGGLGLNFKELRGVQGVVRNLVTLGALATWAVTGTAAYFILGLDPSLACLLGAILSVTGPTVVLPLLDFVKPKGSVGPVLRWEGIVIDPIGALLTVVVFEAVWSGRIERTPIFLGWALLRSALAGGAVGWAAAMVLLRLIRRRTIPDVLHTTLTLAMVLGVFGVANMVQPESGLAAATVFGIVLANQRSVDLRTIVEFKENLRVLLLSSVFILLSARLKLADFSRLGAETFLFLFVLIFVARPLCVTLATWRSPLTWRERLFVMLMAPRGIVAASMASVFSLALETKYDQARLLLPITFASIVGTVVFYGLTAAPIARLLGLAERDPQGLLLAGANRFARELAVAVNRAGFSVQLVDTNRASVSEARTAGLAAHDGSVLGEELLEKLDLTGIGRLLALTPNSEVNLLATERFSRVFGRDAVFQLSPKADARGRPSLELRVPSLFDKGATYQVIEDLMEAGATIKTTRITGSFSYDAFQQMYGDRALVLAIESKGKLQIITTDQKITPRPGQTILSLVRPEAEVAAPSVEEGAMQPV